MVSLNYITKELFLWVRSYKSILTNKILGTREPETNLILWVIKTGSQLIEMEAGVVLSTRRLRTRSSKEKEWKRIWKIEIKIEIKLIFLIFWQFRQL